MVRSDISSNGGRRQVSELSRFRGRIGIWPGLDGKVEPQTIDERRRDMGSVVGQQPISIAFVRWDWIEMSYRFGCWLRLLVQG